MLGRNKLFGSEISDVFWISKNVLTSEREDSIKESFINQEVHFSYPHDLDDFNYLLENFTQDKSEYIDNELGENLQINKLITMDAVSGLADKSNEFSNLTLNSFQKMFFPASMYFIQYIQVSKIGK